MSRASLKTGTRSSFNRDIWSFTRFSSFSRTFIFESIVNIFRKSVLPRSRKCLRKFSGAGASSSSPFGAAMHQYSGLKKRGTYGYIIVLFKLNPMRDLEVVYLLKEIQSMSHGRDIQILQRIMIQMHQYIPRNLIFYSQRVSVRNTPTPRCLTRREGEGSRRAYLQTVRDTAGVAWMWRANCGHRRQSIP